MFDLDKNKYSICYEEENVFPSLLYGITHLKHTFKAECDISFEVRNMGKVPEVVLHDGCKMKSIEQKSNTLVNLTSGSCSYEGDI